MSDSLVKKIHSIAADRFKESDLSHCFIVDVSINAKKIDVYIDGDSDVKFQNCQKLSRSIEAYLDESKILGDKYTLNVSSPGIGRPLKFQRQYPKNVGRNIEIKKSEDVTITGKLISVNEKELVVATPKTKKKESEEHTIRFEEIISSKILISFKK